MDLSRQEYPALLQSLQPHQAVAVLDERVRLIGKVNLDIAEWLSERRRVEEAYVQGLRKLGSRRSNTAPSEFGIFQAAWQSIISSTESLAASHSQLAQRMEADVERPLKSYQRESREMQAMSTIQGNLTAVAKELDAAQKRADRMSGGKASANKVAEAISSAEAIDREWQSQAPYVFEQLQALDENRVNHLRDVLTQLETHEVDQVERSRISAESCLNTLLNVDTKEEISAFVARTSAALPTIQPTTRSRTASGNMLSTTTPSRAQDDRASEISATSEGALRSSSVAGPPRRCPPRYNADSYTQFSTAPTPESKPQRFGLRRLGTVMGRRKDNKKPGDRPPSPEKRSRTHLNPLRRGTSSKNMQAIPSPDEEAMPMPKSPPQRGATSPQPTRSQNVAASPSPPEQRRTNERVNGDVIQPAPPRSSTLPIANGIQTNAAPVAQEPAQVAPAQTSETQRDNEGFNIAPPAHDEISRAQQEAAAKQVLSSLRLFRLDIRSEPIREQGPDAQLALSSVANTLRAQAQQIPTLRKPTANRGRRDVRNTVFVPSPQPPDLPGPGDSPIPPPSIFGNASTLSSEPQQGSDAYSIRSAHSMSSLGQTAAKHAEMTQPGLNGSVVETVSASFSSGQVTKAVVIGELALAHVALEGTPNASTKNIRLENFPVLEKVAPNPSFVTQVPSKSGEYSVNISQISRPAVAFKYQVHLEDSNLAAHAPVVITPSWKIEPKQTSVIVSYGFNPAFVSPSGRSVTMKNVVVVVNLDSTKAQACQSKPVGNFSKEKSLIYWRLGDITLDGYAEAPHKLIARFSTESEGKPGSVEGRWEISGDAAAGLGSGLGMSCSGTSKEEGSHDPFADEGGAGSPTGAWKEVQVQRKLVSGAYKAN
ncbi:MAG: hypothetical protein Q9185_003355 [Variospora sp. 1 TL-2023]